MTYCPSAWLCVAYPLEIFPKVEASNVTNVEVTASGWDLRPEADGGCGVGGCDPRLTRVSPFAPS